MTHISRYRRSLIMACLLVAFFFRTHELAGLGLGLEHDEVAEWLIADGIRHGQQAIFFQEAYGQEPLFLYLMTGSITLLGDNAFGVRFTSVCVAMLTLAAAYRMLRRMFSPTVALVALAGMSIALWPVFWGRVGLRAMTLPLVMCLGFDCLWRGLTGECGARGAECRKWFAAAGLMVGLSAYTYLAWRAIPILLLIYVVYLFLFARDRMRGRWRHLALFTAIAVLVALPMALYLLANPDAQFRVSEVSRPLDQALAGDLSEIGANIPRALGMFTVRGDATVRDNWPDRPVWPEPAGALLFSFGFLVALTQLRQPRSALALLWMGAMLLPTVVTTGAPNFTRTLGALPMVFALPGVAVEWLARWPARLVASRQAQTASRMLAPMGALVLLVVFGVNAAATYDDYFNRWPQHPETQFVFQADFAAIARDVDASDVMDVSVGGLSNDTLDDPSLRLLLRRSDVRLRWFDSGSPLSSGGALIVSPTPLQRVYLPSIVPLSLRLESELQPGRVTQLLTTEHFRRYQSNSNGASGIPPSARAFDDTAILLLPASETTAWTAVAEGELQFETRWIARRPILYPRRIFAHMIDPRTGAIVAQHDGLDAPTRFWQEWDRIVQTHTLRVPAGTPPGRYELRIGLYDPTTGARVLQSDSTRSEPPRDHVVLGAIEVVR